MVSSVDVALLYSSRLDPVYSIAAASVMSAVRLSAAACSAIFAATSWYLWHLAGASGGTGTGSSSYSDDTLTHAAAHDHLHNPADGDGDGGRIARSKGIAIVGSVICGVLGWVSAMFCAAVALC